MPNPVQIELKAKDVNVEKELNKTEMLVASFGKKVVSIFAAIGAAIAVKKIFDLGAGFVAAYGEAQDFDVKLSKALDNVGGKIGVTKDQLDSLAQKLQDTTRFEGDATKNAMAMATAFTNVRGDVFLRMATSAADMAAATGGDLSSAMDKLGRSLNNPLQGMMRLRSEGIIFSEEQQERVAQLVGEGKVMEAQQLILDELDKRYKGMAETMGGTVLGTFERFKNRIGDVGEAIGEMLVPFIEMCLPLFDDLVLAMENLVPIAKEWATALKGAMEVFWDWIKPALVSFGEWTVTAFSIAQVVFENFGEVVSLMADVYTLAVVRMWEETKYYFTSVMPDILKWFGDNWVKIFTDIANFQNTVLINMGKNIWEFIKGVKRMLTGGKSDFKWTGLLDGFEATLDELPKIRDRKKSGLEQGLESSIAGRKKDLGEQTAQRIDDNMAWMKKLFTTGEKPKVDMTTTPDDTYDQIKMPKEEKEKKEKEKKEKEEKEEKGNEGQLEDLVALNRRITQAAGGKSAEKKIEEAIDNNGIRQAQKLDTLIEILRPAADAMKVMPESIEKMDGMPGVLV